MIFILCCHCHYNFLRRGRLRYGAGCVRSRTVHTWRRRSMSSNVQAQLRYCLRPPPARPNECRFRRPRFTLIPEPIHAARLLRTAYADRSSIRDSTLCLLTFSDSTNSFHEICMHLSKLVIIDLGMSATHAGGALCLIFCRFCLSVWPLATETLFGFPVQERA
jgi:hypothetical protein